MVAMKVSTITDGERSRSDFEACAVSSELFIYLLKFVQNCFAVYILLFKIVWFENKSILKNLNINLSFIIYSVTCEIQWNYFKINYNWFPEVCPTFKNLLKGPFKDAWKGSLFIVSVVH